MLDRFADTVLLVPAATSAAQNLIGRVKILLSIGSRETQHLGYPSSLEIADAASVIDVFRVKSFTSGLSFEFNLPRLWDSVSASRRLDRFWS